MIKWGIYPLGYSDFFKITGNKAYSPVPAVKDQNNKRNGGYNMPRNIFAEPLSDDVFVKSPQPQKRLNDIDSKIMNKSLLNYLPTDSLRLELLLENAEAELEITQSEINAQKVLNLDKDNQKMQELTAKKALLEKQIKGYKEQYRELGFLYKISDFFSELYQSVKEKALNLKESFVQNTLVQILAGFIPEIKQKAYVSSLIEKFNAVQLKTSSVMNQKTSPYGEKDSYAKEYEDLAFKSSLLEFQSKRVLAPKENLKTKTQERLETLKEKILFFVSVFVDINVPKT